MALPAGQAACRGHHDAGGVTVHGTTPMAEAGQIFLSPGMRVWGGRLLDGLEIFDEDEEIATDDFLADRAAPTISPKRSPQMGISRLPWAGTTVRPSMDTAISATGKCPPRRWAMRVRSAGGMPGAGVAGPSPCPVMP